MNPLSDSDRAKKTNPYPRLLRRLLRRVLPAPTYRFYFTNHEDASLKLWRAVVGTLSGHSAVLDIGAFQGDYALAAREANPKPLIFAFEPDPENLAVLRRNCEKRSIDICPVALGQRTETAQFLCSASKAQGHLIHRSSENSTIAQSTTVEVMSLDDWARQSGAKPALIKMDVEGGEPNIIQGASQTLSVHRPTMLVEVLSGEAGERLRSVLPANYHFFQINERDGITEQPRMSRPYWHSRNWLLVSEGPALFEQIGGIM